MRRLEPRAVVQRNAVDPLHRQHVVRGEIPLDQPARESPDRRGCSPPSPTARLPPAAGPSPWRPSGSSVRTISIGFSRRASADSASIWRAANISASRSTLKLCATFGRSTFTATRRRTPFVLDLGAMHLRDRGGRDRGAEARIGLLQRTIECRDDGRFRFRLRERRHAVLQAFQVARERHADDIGAGRKELAELHVARAEMAQRGRNPSDRLVGLRRLDQAAEPQRELRARRKSGRIDDAEHAGAREHDSLRGSAGRDGSALRSQTPARMQRDDAAAHHVPRRAREVRPCASSPRTRSAAETGGSIRRDSDRTRRRRSPCARAPG